MGKGKRKTIDSKRGILRGAIALALAGAGAVGLMAPQAPQNTLRQTNQRTTINAQGQQAVTQNQTQRTTNRTNRTPPAQHAIRQLPFLGGSRKHPKKRIYGSTPQVHRTKKTNRLKLKAKAKRKRSRKA